MQENYDTHFNYKGGDVTTGFAIYNTENQDFSELLITLKTDKLVELSLIPDIFTSAQNSFEFRKLVYPSPSYQTLSFYLRHSFWQKKVDN